MNEIKNRKAIQNNNVSEETKIQIEHVFLIGQDIGVRLDELDGNVEKAIEISSLIQRQLNEQI
jgi:hypothetical protein